MGAGTSKAKLTNNNVYAKYNPTLIDLIDEVNK